MFLRTIYSIIDVGSKGVFQIVLPHLLCLPLMNVNFLNIETECTGVLQNILLH